MWVALFVMLGLGATYLKLAPPADARRSAAESSFWRSTSFMERKALHSLVDQLRGEAASFASLDLDRLVTASQTEFLLPRGIRTATHGPRDLCLVDLPDGGILRLTVFDDRNAARFAAIWTEAPELGMRLRFVEGLGWQCSLHTGIGPRTELVASVYGWLAEIDRSHQRVKS